MPKDDSNILASGNSCLPIAMLENAKQPNMIEKSRLFSSEEELKRRGSVFSGQSFYVDGDVSAQLQNKVLLTSWLFPFVFEWIFIHFRYLKSSIMEG